MYTKKVRLQFLGMNASASESKVILKTHSYVVAVMH